MAVEVFQGVRGYLRGVRGVLASLARTCVCAVARAEIVCTPHTPQTHLCAVKSTGRELRGVCGVRDVVGVVTIKKQVTPLVGCDTIVRMAMMLLRRVDGPCGSVRLYQGPSGRLAEVTEVAKG